MLFPPFHPDVPEADIRLGKRMEKVAIALGVVITLMLGVLLGGALTGTAEAKGGYSSSPSRSSAPSAPSRSTTTTTRTTTTQTQTQRPRSTVQRSTPQANQSLTDDQKKALERSQAQRNAQRRIQRARAQARQRVLIAQRANMRPRAFPRGTKRVRNARGCTAAMWRLHHPGCDRYRLYASGGGGYYLATHEKKSHTWVWWVLGGIVLIGLIILVIWLVRRNK